MGESKHTSWKFVAPHFIGTDEADPQTIAYLDDHRNRRSWSVDEMRAHGRLIAAAPQMLEALRKAGCVSNLRPCRNLPKGECAVCAAIKAATGGET